MRLRRWRERSGRALAGALALGTSLSGASAMPVYRQALERWIEETNDQGRIPEAEAVARALGATRPGSNPNDTAIVNPKE